jgi:hypothetical protein
MGIDIYMRPNRLDSDGGVGYSDEASGFDTTAGQHGYLREAYHGGPYVTEVLVPEAFAWVGWIYETCPVPVEDWPEELELVLAAGAPIRAATLRERLLPAEVAFWERIKNVYPNTDGDLAVEQWQAFVDFVELAERIEAATGEAVQVYASY